MTIIVGSPHQLNERQNGVQSLVFLFPDPRKQPLQNLNAVRHISAEKKKRAVYMYRNTMASAQYFSGMTGVDLQSNQRVPGDS